MADIAWLIHACMSVVFYALWFGLFPAMCNVLQHVLALCVCVCVLHEASACINISVNKHLCSVTPDV